MLNLIYFYSLSFFNNYASVIFKIDFFIPKKGMHTYTFLKMRKRSVTCGAFFNALQLIYRKKKRNPF